MHKKVAVEQNLANVAQYFEKNGYQVDTISDSEIDTIGGISNYDAIIVSGGNIDFMGIEETNTRTPMIDATGLTASEIFNRVNR